MNARQRLLDALAAGGLQPNGSASRCPAHDDRNASLSIGNRADGNGVVVNCHAGCSANEIVAALGWKLADLFDEPRQDAAPRRVVAEYDYLDEQGTVLFQKVRYEPKDFRQRHLVGREWVWNLNGTRRVLYRWPEVLRSEGPVYLAEGEKDADALTRAGVTATTWTEGAWKGEQRPKWRSEYTDALKGRHVVIVRDRDESGRHTAATIAELVKASAASVRIVEPAEGKDAHDHLSAGLGVAELVTVGEEPIQGPRVVTLSSVTPERVRWLWPARLPVGKLVVIDGDPSTGKSTLTNDMAARVSTGTHWPDGEPCPAGDVLLLSAEDGLADTITPRLTAAGADLTRVHVLTEVPERSEDGTIRMVPPSLPRDLPHIRAIIERHKVKLVVIDVLMAFLSGKVDSHRDQDVRGVLHLITAIAEATGCTVICIRHMNKSGGSNALYRGGGSIGIVGAARAAFIVARDPEDNDRRVFAVTKSNLAAEPPALAYRLVDAPEHGCARVEWESDPVNLSAGDLLHTADMDDRSESADAAEWLTEFLSAGSVARKDVLKAAKGEGYSEKVLRRAREKAGVKAERVGFPSVTYWSVPEPAESTVVPTDNQSSPPKSVGMTGMTGHDWRPEEPCTICRFPLPTALVEAGETTHATCEE